MEQNREPRNKIHNSRLIFHKEAKAIQWRNETLQQIVLEQLDIHMQKNECRGTSLVSQWLRICLPMQGTRVRSLVQEDPTCHGATKPVCHNYWACALGPTCCTYWAWAPQLLKPTCLESVLHNKGSHRNEKPAHHNEEKPPLTTSRESPHAATKTQCSQKKKKNECRWRLYILDKN